MRIEHETLIDEIDKSMCELDDLLQVETEKFDKWKQSEKQANTAELFDDAEKYLNKTIEHMRDVTDAFGRFAIKVRSIQIKQNSER